MGTANVQISPSLEFGAVKKEGMLRQTWKGLKKNKLAMVGLVLIILLIIMQSFIKFINGIVMLIIRKGSYCDIIF